MTKDEFVKLLDAYKMRCENVCYADGQLDGLRDKFVNASNPDDKEAYESGIERMKSTIDYNQEIRDEIRSKLINSFKGGEEMTEINKDVLAINEAMDRFASANESIGYANGSIAELISERIHARNEDDRNAFNSQIERMNYEVSECKDARDQAREDIKKTFEHYYS